MKNKLYYQDSYIHTFEAKVLKQDKDVEGNTYVILNHTAFYPTGGGQPYDTGKIAGVDVVNVEERDEEILHFLKCPLTVTESVVPCEVNWERRFDHMQQHTGQHILSAAFDNLFHYKTVGFHLGSEIVTIDLDTENLTIDEVRKAEEAANQIIKENRPVEVKWVTEADLHQYPLRKETKVKEDIRLVIIPDFDYNGCGGTHPSATGQVQSIKVLDWERQKKKTRLQFVCGHRVLNQLGQKHTILLELTKLLNSPEQDMESTVVRLLQQRKQTEKMLEEAKENLLAYEARELVSQSANNVVCELLKNRSLQELQKLARIITAESKEAMVLLVAENGRQLQLVCARGVSRTENMKNMLTGVLPLINGKGGGSSSFAQGGGEALLSGNQLLEHLLTIEMI